MMSFKHQLKKRSRTGFAAAACLAAILLSGCDREGLTTAELQESVKERVRSQLGLTKQTVLFANTFVGEPLNGDTTICGTVAGARPDGTKITPRRFIAATEPARWIKFEPVTDPALPSQPDKFVEWLDVCLRESEE